MYEDAGVACAREFLVHPNSQIHGDVTKEDCMQACSEDIRCQYLFLNTAPSCFLYTDCSQTRTPAYRGTTWRKVEGNLT